MDNKNWPKVLVAALITLCLGMGFLWQWNWDKKEYNKYPDRGLPRLEIKLNGVSLEEINNGSKETRYNGNEVKLYNDGKIDDFDNVEVKGRGNGTWTQEKKPYQIKFEKKVDLLGMGKTRKWVLLANATDKTNLRNETALRLAEMLGMQYAWGGEFVELYVDEEYEGIYYLLHAVEIDKKVVGLKDALGVLVELDNLYWVNEEKYYETGNGDKLTVKDAVTDELADAAMREFLQDYNEFEVAVKDGDFEKVGELVDVRSFVQYYLLNEFVVNPDAYWTSFYMYKDGSDDKIHAGPVWDFDLALSNRSWGNWLGEKFYSPTETMVRKNEIMPVNEYAERGMGEWISSMEALSTIMFDLMELPEFQEEVKVVYSERMAGRMDEMLWRLGAEAQRISEAVRADEERWGKEGFEEEIKTMTEWIEERYGFFESEYGYI